MATEIELKAWVDDPKDIQSIIGTFATYIKDYEKEDAYWLPEVEITPMLQEQKRGKLGSGIRVRKENGDVFVTLKNKEVREGIEINDELEFSVSNAQTFEQFLRSLGYAPWIRKQKTGKAWRWNNITIELSLVANLGWFAELEIIAETNEPEQIEQAQKDLHTCLEMLGIPMTKIESRYYTELLLERGSA